MVHCGGIRQTASILGMDKAILRTGDRALVRFRYVHLMEIFTASRIHESWGSGLVPRGANQGVGKSCFRV